MTDDLPGQLLLIPTEDSTPCLRCDAPQGTNTGCSLCRLHRDTLAAEARAEKRRQKP